MGSFELIELMLIGEVPQSGLFPCAIGSSARIRPWRRLFHCPIFEALEEVVFFALLSF